MASFPNPCGKGVWDRHLSLPGKVFPLSSPCMFLRLLLPQRKCCPFPDRKQELPKSWAHVSVASLHPHPSLPRGPFQHRLPLSLPLLAFSTTRMSDSARLCGRSEDPNFVVRTQKGGAQGRVERRARRAHLGAPAGRGASGDPRWGEGTRSPRRPSAVSLSCPGGNLARAAHSCSGAGRRPPPLGAAPTLPG